ncbi:MAG: hypothetical protein ACUVRZ_08960 [Desulfobacca sp.]|uniref:hypothetical protein n=1 Tax=Desulfobacca sp. TaxID=2067990 RepID=UPI00404A4B33
MIDFLNNYLLTPYVQAVLFFLLIGLFFLQYRRRASLVSMSLSWLRTIILLVLFLYFGWNWASEIPPSLRAASVLGMFLINLSMIFDLLLGSLEAKYQQALEAYAQDAANKALLEKVWSSGRRYLWTRFFLEALLSGHAPGAFLQGVMNYQIPSDIKRVLAQHGVAAAAVSHQTLLTFLAARLDQSSLLPMGLKEVIAQTLKQFAEHAWLREQVDDFLQLAMTDPQQLTEVSTLTKP